MRFNNHQSEKDQRKKEKDKERKMMETKREKCDAWNKMTIGGKSGMDRKREQQLQINVILK